MPDENSDTERKKIKFNILNFGIDGDFKKIRNEKEYVCLPLYVISVDKRLWLVGIQDKRGSGYYDSYTYYPLDLMDDIKAEKYSVKLSEYLDIINKNADLNEISTYHQIGGSFFSYEKPVWSVIKLKYNKRMMRIPYDLLLRSFGEDYYTESDGRVRDKNGNVKNANEEVGDGDFIYVMVKRSPYSVLQWAKLSEESVEIEGFYDNKGNVIESENERIKRNK